MKKLLFVVLTITISLNADYLKNDEFDINKLGKTFESYVQQTDKHLSYYKNLVIQNRNKIEQLSNEIIKLKQIINQKETKQVIKTSKVIKHDIRTVNTKKGIIAYSEPFSEEDLYLKKYEYTTHLEIESCDKYGWCKIKDEEEYVAGYLLSNENK